MEEKMREMQNEIASYREFEESSRGFTVLQEAQEEWVIKKYSEWLTH